MDDKIQGLIDGYFGKNSDIKFNRTDCIIRTKGSKYAKIFDPDGSKDYLEFDYREFFEENNSTNCFTLSLDIFSKTILNNRHLENLDDVLMNAISRIEKSSSFIFINEDEKFIFCTNDIDKYTNNRYSVELLEKGMTILSHQSLINYLDYARNVLNYFKSDDFKSTDDSVIGNTIIYQLSLKGLVAMQFNAIDKIPMPQNLKDILSHSNEVINTLQNIKDDQFYLKKVIQECSKKKESNKSVIDFWEAVLPNLYDYIHTAKNQRLYDQLSKGIENYQKRDLVKSYNEVRSSYFDLLKNLVGLPAIIAGGTLAMGNTESTMAIVLTLLALGIAVYYYISILKEILEKNMEVKKQYIFDKNQNESPQQKLPDDLQKTKDFYEESIISMMNRVEDYITKVKVITFLLFVIVFVYGLYKISVIPQITILVHQFIRIIKLTLIMY
jgi:hypothetical protein